jgi:Right handed beta helix region
VTARTALSNLLRVIVITALAIAGISLAWPTRPATASTINLYVSPQGLDRNTGLTPSVPLHTIQAALNIAKPGTTIHLAPGTYHEEPTTKVNGTAAAPISLVGTETGFSPNARFKTVLTGTGRVLNINNSYYEISGFTIDGQEALRSAAWPTTLAAVRPFKDAIQAQVADSRLIYLGSSDTSRNVSYVHIDDMFLHGAGGECVRLRNDASHDEISNSTIEYCGLLGKGNDLTSYKYHNGEGIYVGTSPSDPTQPMYTDDATAYNTITGNRIETFGSECVDIKENAHNNVVSSNLCEFNDEPATFEGSNLEIRGLYNSISNNVLSGSRGYGLKLGTDGPQYSDRGNTITANSFANDAAVAILNKNGTAQATACANGFDATPFLEGYALPNLKAPCTVAPAKVTTPTPTPTPKPTPTPTPSPTTANAISIEAESGSRTGSMARVAQADAQAGWYLTQSTTGPATATYTFTVTTPGLYSFAARVIAPSASSDSIYYRFDAGLQNEWGFSQHLTTWSWFTASGVTPLTAGTHTLVVTGREPDTRLDAFRLVPVS